MDLLVVRGALCPRIPPISPAFPPAGAPCSGTPTPLVLPGAAEGGPNSNPAGWYGPWPAGPPFMEREPSTLSGWESREPCTAAKGAFMLTARFMLCCLRGLNDSVSAPGAGPSRPGPQRTPAAAACAADRLLAARVRAGVRPLGDAGIGDGDLCGLSAGSWMLRACVMAASCSSCSDCACARSWHSSREYLKGCSCAHTSSITPNTAVRKQWSSNTLVSAPRGRPHCTSTLLA
mmetsp:Transcript_32811/g.83286  ORF Transcript_32811/g.83286 Transcript_32811/m.83286 type:complete len:233 (+) Transcript_32811:91-789(+)